jgi:hypothetical protein
MKVLFAAALLFTACAGAAPKSRAPASGEIPKCWQAYNARLHDGLYHITIPANDKITAKDVQTMLFTLQNEGIESHSASAFGSDILLEVQFFAGTKAKQMGYPTQDKLDELVEFTLKDDVQFLAKGVTISCFEETPLRSH